MTTPAIILLVFVFLDIVAAMALHGKPKGTWNAGLTVLNSAGVLSLLYWGGFFA